MYYIKGINIKDGYPKNRYPYNIPAVKHIDKNNGLTFDKPITFLVGENGTGKSTLIEAIAVSMGLNPEGGSKDTLFSTNDTHSDLYDYLKIIKFRTPKDSFFLRAESFYNVASYLDGSRSDMVRYGGESLNNQSHGESFIALVQNRFEGNGLYILDEPEAALSPQRLMSLMVIIDEKVKNNSQFIIATHSSILMTMPDSTIYQFTSKGIEKVDYRETEHYKITKQFIDNPERMIKYLLG